MKRLLALVLALTVLSGCVQRPAEDHKTHILCTTYPVYLLTTAVTGDDADVVVELMIKEQTSCLHDYTLTVADMRLIEQADIIIINGAGLERFMEDALAQSAGAVIDCSVGIDLLPSPDGDEDEPDPHIWMDPDRAAQMMGNIAEGLAACTGRQFSSGSMDLLPIRFPWSSRPDVPPFPLITFHDGFQYFADAFGLELLRSIEEEEGAEASAKELKEIIELVRERGIPAIFVEKNGSRRSADVIARETGCKVYELDMIMSGEGDGIEAYRMAISQDLSTVYAALAREEAAP